MNIVKRYRKKPIEIEAMQNDGTMESAQDVVRWAEGSWMETRQSRRGPEFPNYVVMIRTLEGVMRADPGDWIIKGIESEFYPVKPDIFDATYEDVE